jgi:zinc protease
VVTFAFAQAPDRSKPPAAGPQPTLKLPPIQHFTLSNGMKVVLMEKHELPLVEMELMVNTGSVMNPSDKPGLASMVAEMMDEGAGSRNALELADAISFLGANIFPYAGMHTSGVSLHTPLSMLDAAIELFADIIMRPTFPADELERKKKERLTRLMQWHDEPRAIANVIFGRTLYGTKHPYGIPDIGNEKSLRAMKSEDLKAFHAQNFLPSNSTLVIVGDVAKNGIQQKLEKTFAGWQGGKTPEVKLPSIDQVSGRKIYLVDKPGAAQSVLRFGRIGVERMTDDYYAIQVMNTILGGSFSSRLNQNIREEHGYAYGANSSFSFRPMPGPFTAASDVQTNKTDSALIEFMKELRGISDISDDDLARGKNYLALGYPDNFSSLGSIAGMLSELVLYNLPDDYFNNYIQKILAVTKDDVVRVAKKYIDTENIAVIVVGDKKEIEKGIKALNLGSIKNYSIVDVLGKAPKIEEAK